MIILACIIIWILCDISDCVSDARYESQKRNKEIEKPRKTRTIKRTARDRDGRVLIEEVTEEI